MHEIQQSVWCSGSGQPSATRAISVYLVFVIQQEIPSELTLQHVFEQISFPVNMKASRDVDIKRIAHKYLHVFNKILLFDHYN